MNIWHFLYLSILLLSGNDVLCKPTNIEVRKIKLQFTSDTIMDLKTAQLSYKIRYDSDSIVIKSYYHIVDPEDFSFLYSQLYDSSSVWYNNDRLSIGDSAHSPDIQNYHTSNYLYIFSASSYKYIVVFGKPFFCNGLACSDVSTLCICIPNDSDAFCVQYNNHNNDISTVYSFIKNKLIKCNKFMVPIWIDNQIKWVVPTKK